VVVVISSCCEGRVFGHWCVRSILDVRITVRSVFTLVYVAEIMLEFHARSGKVDAEKAAWRQIT
jgi:hypothetical protein